MKKNKNVKPNLRDHMEICKMEQHNFNHINRSHNGYLKIKKQYIYIYIYIHIYIALRFMKQKIFHEDIISTRSKNNNIK